MGNEQESGQEAQLQEAQRQEAQRKVTARLAESADSVATLRKSVESGELVLDPKAGDELRNMLGDQRDQVDKWLARANDLGRQAPLGNNPVAEAMAGKFAHRTTGEDGSFTVVLERYRTVLDDAHDAVSAAMREYHKIEENASETFRSLQQ